MHLKKSTLNFLISALFMLIYSSILSKNLFSVAGRSNPSVVIHDTLVGPGELLLQMDAFNFTGDNGQVSAISLKIDVDTNLISFIGIQNTTLPGSWLANYNYQQNEITIIYTAYSGNGYDIDGKLLDLHLYYNAGFDASLHFKDGCEISNVYLQTIDSIDYVDGLITQVAPLGVVSQDSLAVDYGTVFSMPVLAGGTGFDSVNGIRLRVGYDAYQLQFEGVTDALLSGIAFSDTLNVITCDWDDTISFYDLTSTDTLFYLNYLFVGDTVTATSFLPGSKVFNNGMIVPSTYESGEVTARYWLELLSSPDTAGATSGGGFYLSGDTATVTAYPAEGFEFGDWLHNDSIVSYDSIYNFVTASVQDTLTAEFKARTYNVLLFAVPDNGGTVSGAGDYQYGDSVTVIAAPNSGYDFVAWTFGDDTLSVDTSYTFIMPHNNMGLTANFQIQTFDINAVSNNPDYGSVTGGGQFNYGDTCNLVATSNLYYYFVVWTENGQPVSYDSAYSFEVNQNRELVANFQYDEACSAPVGLYVDSLSDSTAMLHWLSSGEENEWDLLWGVMGFDTATSGELIQGLDETQYFLENLSAGSTYDFYVRAVCTDEIHSIWAGPYTFTTWYVGIKEKDFSNGFLVYPNPAVDELTLLFDTDVASAHAVFAIYNSTGQVVLSSTLNKSKTISLRGLPMGVYYIRVSSNGKLYSDVFIRK